VRDSLALLYLPVSPGVIIIEALRASAEEVTVHHPENPEGVELE